MKRLAILISNAGSGTNLQAIIDAIEDGKLMAKIVLVVSSNVDAYGLTRAKKHNIKTLVVSKKDDLEKILNDHQVDFIALAGWKLIIIQS